MSRSEAVGAVIGALWMCGCSPDACVLRELRELVTGEPAARDAIEAIRAAAVYDRTTAALRLLRARASERTIAPRLALSVAAARANGGSR